MPFWLREFCSFRHRVISRYIARASGSGFDLYAAIYELGSPDSDAWPNILQAFKEVKARGAKLHLICHGLDDHTGKHNRELIHDMGLDDVCIFRENAKLMHNKFMVLCQNGQAISTWTGSTNLSRNGLFGQLNVGHAIHDQPLSEAFLAYWHELSRDPADEQIRAWAAAWRLVTILWSIGSTAGTKKRTASAKTSTGFIPNSC